MHHELLKSCLPLLIALAVLFAIAQLVVRLSGARLHLRRLADVHRCEAGGVQSLAFVLTLPIFLMVVMFVVQIALVMIGLITVNTAAFAAARSASVWIPAEVIDSTGNSPDEPQNYVFAPISADSAHTVSYTQWEDPSSSVKCDKIFEAAVLACVPMAPSSRKIAAADGSTQRERQMLSSLTGLYGQLVSKPVDPSRLQRKLAYALRRTRVTLNMVDREPDLGPTYNAPRGALPGWDHIDNEFGWQDSVTVTVEHDFALLPGPGRFLARRLTRYDGGTDDVAPRIESQGSTYTTKLRASATLSVEGLKSARPYEQTP